MIKPQRPKAAPKRPTMQYPSGQKPAPLDKPAPLASKKDDQLIDALTAKRRGVKQR